MLNTELSTLFHSIKLKDLIYNSSQLSSNFTTIDLNLNRIFIDGNISSELSLVHISQAEYNLKYITGELKDNALYIIDDNYIEAFDQQIKNLSLPTDEYDATNKIYVDSEINSLSTYVDSEISSTKQYAESMIFLSSDVSIDEVSAYLSSIDRLKSGTLAIIKNTSGMSGNNYTGYIYNNNRFEAFAGNYTADNIYMNGNIQLGGDYTSVGNIHLSDGELSCDGWSVTEMFNLILSKILHESEVKPVITISGAQNIEIGLTVNITYNIAYSTNPSTYTYKTKDNTSISVNSLLNNVYVKENGSDAIELSLQSTKLKTINRTIPVGPYSSTGSKYELSVLVDYTDGSIPCNNMGVADPDYKYKAGTESKKLNMVTVYKPIYYMFTNVKTINPTTLDAASSNIGTSNVINKWCKKLLTNPDTVFTAPEAYYEFFVLLPKGAKSSWKGVDGTGVNSLPTEEKTSMQLTLRDNTKADYEVFTVRNKASKYTNLKCTMTWSN